MREIPREISVIIIVYSIFTITSAVSTPKSSSSGNGLVLSHVPKTEHSLIYLANKTQATLIGQINSSLREYFLPKTNRRLVECTFSHPAARGRVCDVDPNDWGPCQSQNEYQYGSSAPCVFLRIDRNTSWIPEYYNKSAELPDDMPVRLKEYFNNSSPEQRNTLWLSCEGKDPVDREFLGATAYYPSPGFPGYIFPLNTLTELSPVVAVRFDNPKVGVLVFVQCRLWAKNLDEKNGTTLFHILVD